MKLSPVLTLVTLLAVCPLNASENWPFWRGDITGSGETAADASLPTEWGQEKNVKWQTELPERGNSTPAIWDDKIFLTQAIDAKNWRGLLCLDRRTGEEIWRNGLTYDKEERTHRSNPFCSASAATDGKVVIASYGSAGVAAYDFAGKELWRRDLGAIDHVWGNSTSPIIHGDVVIHYHGPALDAVLYGLDKNTGETVWKYEEPFWKPENRTDGFKGRDGEGVIGSFSTPIIYNTGERDELAMSFPLEMRAFDPATGKTLWTCQGLNPLVYTSPVYDNGIVVAMGGYHGNTVAVRTGGSGDVTETHRLWQKVRDDGGIGSGVAKDGNIYYHDSGGVIFCVDMKTGGEHWKARLPGVGKSWGSLVLAGDHIYSLSQAGDCAIFKATPDRFEEVGVNDLGEETNSSIAVAKNQIFIRTYEALRCIEKP